MRHYVTALVFFLFAACGFEPIYFNSTKTVDSSEENSEQGGGATVQLPFARSEERLCVQGAHGSYSHTGASTLHDLDFDTSNSEQEEIYAPEAGVVRVHTESATTNFGYHINLDLGDGTYLVLGHFSKIFVADGDEVAPGTLLGYEGCTGSCTGDHVHFGRHEGDAALQAQYGTSIATNIRAADATAEEEYDEPLSDDFVCGETGGHWYFSDLSVPFWHPNGTLIKVPSSSEVYLIEDGAKRWIRDEEIFWSRGYNFANLTLISNEELACFGNGEEIAEAGLVAAYTDESGQRWLVVGVADDSDRYRQMLGDTAWDGVMTSWGLTYSAFSPPPVVSTYDDWPALSGYAGFRDGALVKEDSRSDVYVITEGVAVPIIDWNTYLLAGFYQRQIIPVPDGAVAKVQADVGDCSAGLWCLTAENLTTCGGGFDLSGAGDYGGDDNENPNDYGDTDEEIPCEDNDLDGHCSEYSGGDDCWDYNPYVYPGAEEICGNGVDEDCSGADEVCPDDEWDTDSDGIVDSLDNCVYHDNPDQSDIDDDGAGDSCDSDMDGDGVENSEDCDMTDPDVTYCDTGEEVEADVDTDVDADTDTDSDTDSDTDTDSDSDADADAGSSGWGIMTVNWLTGFSYDSDSLEAIYEYAETSAGFATWFSTSFSVEDNNEITFSFMVPYGYAVRYNVTSDAYGHEDWSCESTSTSETGDALTGFHEVSYMTSAGADCGLTPEVYHKTAGIVDGCEALVFAECE